MKRSPGGTYFLTPQAEGWAVWCGPQRLHIMPTLEEAAARLPAGVPFQFALPCYPLIMERLRLPAVERGELEGMVHLQWEKALPFLPEEITGNFLTLETGEGHSIVWSSAVSLGSLEEFSACWRKLRRWPKRMAPYVCHVAAKCPADETVLVVYAEPGHWVLAVIEDRRPSWVHVIPSMDGPRFAAEFPSLQLTANLEGAPTTYSRVLVTAETAATEEALRATLDVPIERLPLVPPSDNLEIDLLPTGWRAESQQRHSGQRLRHQLMIAGAVYLAVIIAGAVHVGLLQHQAAQLDADLKVQRPTIAAMEARKTLWNALAPAINPRHYAVEMLYLLQRCLPDEKVQFTEFEQTAQEWRVVGEAPSASLAIDYLAKLKRDPDLSSNQITADPPRLLPPNDRAQFQVIGKP